eukprot:TRINITY_DN20598_c0_g2_i1.p1 TRINITY_DN20598_c0_g2~~TRINITY_DN20598_c0_g2_i1.p1  ORF type:complete len:376 (-),score=80.58 TRINITY_DN20598_c0_g2_i1:76-1062(-)
MADCVAVAVTEARDSTSAELAIRAPANTTDKMTKLVTNLRDAAAKAKDDSEAGGAAFAEDAGKLAEGVSSFFGGRGASVLGKIAAGVGAAGDVVSGAAGTTAAEVLTTFADGVQQTIDSLDKSFSTVGQELAGKKYEAIIEVYQKAIAESEMMKSSSKAGDTSKRSLVRGEPPFGPEQYAACPLDRITTTFNAASAKSLEEQLSPAVRDEIANSAVVSTFNSTKENYTKANDFLGKSEVLKKFQGEPIEVDIKEYIVAQVIEKIGNVMAKREAEVRKQPASKVTLLPDTFAICFSGGKLTNAVYKRYKQELKDSTEINDNPTAPLSTE